MSTAPHALLTTDAEVRICGPNWTSWIRTSECRSQSPVPYRLAIAHRRLIADTACQYEYKRKGWVVGLEPTISRTTIWRANQLHHTHHNEPGGIRTLDLRLRRPLLYPAELQAQDGAGDGNRTHTTSLEGWDSTIELHPHQSLRLCDACKFYHKLAALSTVYIYFLSNKIAPPPRSVAGRRISIPLFFQKRFAQFQYTRRVLSFAPFEYRRIYRV